MSYTIYHSCVHNYPEGRKLNLTHGIQMVYLHVRLYVYSVYTLHSLFITAILNIRHNNTKENQVEPHHFTTIKHACRRTQNKQQSPIFLRFHEILWHYSAYVYVEWINDLEMYPPEHCVTQQTHFENYPEVQYNQLLKNLQRS